MKTCRPGFAVFLSLACTASSATLYVNVNSVNATPPYSTWITAATTIQDAVDAAVDGDEIIVTNGIYATGGRTMSDTTTNRVAVSKAVAVRSVNGPQYTVIQGYQVPGTTNGTAGIRCVALTDGASLSGFTLTNGATKSGGFGGGVRCFSTAAAVSNCVIVGNSATLTGSGSIGGGGSFSGTLISCTLIGNSAANAGGAAGGILNRCTLVGNMAVAGGGGGAKNATLNNCVVTSNSAAYQGGGTYGGTVNNCLFMANSSSQGGGAYSSTLNNCTLTGNTGGTGGGVHSGTLNNCIVFDNFATTGDNYAFGVFSYCCTTPDPGGPGNLTNAPLFVDSAGGNFRLTSGSPCINVGNNGVVTNSTDLDGNTRIVGDTVDLGAYEFQGAGARIDSAWLQQYGLPADGSADFLDSDGDGLNNWQEWRCGTNPTNALSVFKLTLARGASGTTVTWPSAIDRSYTVERAGILSPVPLFQVLQTNIAGQPGTTTYTDTSALGGRPFFYRIGVQP